MGSRPSLEQSAIIANPQSSPFENSVAATSPVDSILGDKVFTGSVIKYSFIPAGESLNLNTDIGNDLGITTNWSDDRKELAREAMASISSVADIRFEEAENGEVADWRLGGGQSFQGASWMDLPCDGQQTMFLNWGDVVPRDDNLDQGGRDYAVMLHEIGHGLGLLHPHDDLKLNGVDEFVDRGDFKLNQGVYTVMSFNRGLDSDKPNRVDAFTRGNAGTMMALDVAALQQMYGANTSNESGNNVYELGDLDVAGTHYSSIWDTGGIDTLAYNGSRDAVLDLRPATLQYENGGGGFASSTNDVHGGFTIANGVTIENAVGGSGNDVLLGGGGSDKLHGGTGDNILHGGNGGDNFIISGSGKDTIRDFQTLVDKIDITHFSQGSQLSFDSLNFVDRATGVELNIRDKQIFLQGVMSGDLDASDFII